MGFDAHSNFGYSLVATAPSPANSGTTLTVIAGQGAFFPLAPFNATVFPANAIPLASNAEIIRVTSKGSGDNWTILRTQEGSSARSVQVGDQIVNAVTVKVITDLEGLFPVTEANLSITNITTGNVSTSAHGFAPIATAPAVNVRTALVIDNAETLPTFKVALDATNPTTIGVSDVASPGTSLIFAHRDHQHGSPATFPATAHNILSTTHGDTLADSVVRGDIFYGNATPKWARLALGGIAGSVVTRNATDVLWSTFALAGTAGQTYTFPAVSGTGALGAGTLTVATANDATIAAHTHAITSSSNPGATAAILASTAAGGLSLQTQSLYNSLTFLPVSAPSAPTIGSITAGGAVNDGAHYYFITFVTALGETNAGTVSTIATTGGGNNTVNLAGIPVSADARVTDRRIYRTKAGGSTYYLVATLAGNVASTYSDTTADASLGADDASFRANTTSGKVFRDSTMVAFISENVTAIGFESWASATQAYHSLAIGAKACRDTTTGYNLTAVGVNSLLLNTVGYGDVAVGVDSMHDNISGYWATAVGIGSAHDNINGYSFVAVGKDSAYHNQSGNSFVAIGDSAMFSAISTGNLVAIGTASLYSAIAGGHVAVGSNSLKYITSGTDDIGIGFLAGAFLADTVTQNTISSSSIYIGAQAYPLADGDVNEIIIGANVSGLGSNSVVIGNTNILKTVLRGNLGVGLDSPAGKIESSVRLAAGGTVSAAYGFKTSVDNFLGTLTKGYGYYSYATVSLNYQTTDSFYNFFAASPVVVTNAALNNVYGLYLDTQKTANVGNAFGVYQAGTSDINYFAANVLVGTLTDGMTASGSLAIAKDLAHRGTLAGFFNTTPIAQPTTAVAAATFAANTSGIADDSATFDGYTIGQLAKIIRNLGLAA